MGRRNAKQRKILDGATCIFCGGSLPAETIEHAPPKALFRKKFRPKGYEFPACARCNNGSSQLDQVASFFLLVGGNGLEPRPDRSDSEKLLRGIANNSPQALGYFGFNGLVEEVEIESDAERFSARRVRISQKLFAEFLNPWAAKLGCALWYYHTGVSVSEEQRLYIDWYTNDDYLRHGRPEKTIENLSEYASMSQGKISFHDQFAYKFEINEVDGVGGFFVGFHAVAAALIVIIPASKVMEFHAGWRYGDLFRTGPRTGIHACMRLPLARL